MRKNNQAVKAYTEAQADLEKAQTTLQALQVEQEQLKDELEQTVRSGREAGAIQKRQRELRDKAEVLTIQVKAYHEAVAEAFPACAKAQIEELGAELSTFGRQGDAEWREVEAAKKAYYDRYERYKADSEDRRMRAEQIRKQIDELQRQLLQSEGA